MNVVRPVASSETITTNDKKGIGGSFAVELPTGSYRVTDANLHTRKGIRYTGLPKTFTVLPGEGRSLGGWKRELENELRTVGSRSSVSMGSVYTE